jgi:hypothetical protein
MENLLIIAFFRKRADLIRKRPASLAARENAQKMHIRSSGPENRAAKKALYERNFHPAHEGSDRAICRKPENRAIGRPVLTMAPEKASQVRDVPLQSTLSGRNAPACTYSSHNKQRISGPFLPWLQKMMMVTPTGIFKKKKIRLWRNHHVAHSREICEGDSLSPP